MNRLALFILTLFAVGVSFAENQQPPAGGQKRFDSLSTGVSLIPPEGFRLSQRNMEGVIAQYTEPSTSRQLALVATHFERPMRIQVAGGEGSFGAPGAQDFVKDWRDRIRLEHPDCEILRCEPVMRGKAVVCDIVYRYRGPSGPRTVLQTAFARTLTIFAIVEISGPGAQLASGPVGVDPSEMQLLAVQKAVSDSLEFIDLTSLREDQDQRLLRTRELLTLGIEAKLRASAGTNLCLRIRREGKDIGFRLVSAEATTLEARPALAVGTYERLVLPGTQLKSEVTETISFDRREESFTGIYTADEGATKSTLTQQGKTSKVQTGLVDAPLLPGETQARKQASVRELFHLRVLQVNNSEMLPAFEKDVSPYYLPQALCRILPMLVPTVGDQTYMFASWDTQKRAVLMRYVDVGKEQDFDFDGRKIRAVPVKDKIGLDGVATTHLVSRDGKYVGSVIEETGETWTACNRDDITHLWPDAGTTQPGKPAK